MLQQINLLNFDFVLCWLATVDEESFPNVSPKEIWSIYDEKTIVIANIASAQSAKNIAINQRVCLSFIDIFKQKGYKIKGIAENILPENLEYSKFSPQLNTMLGKKFSLKSIFKIIAIELHEIVAPSYFFYPDETTENSQRKAAILRYGLKESK